MNLGNVFRQYLLSFSCLFIAAPFFTSSWNPSVQSSVLSTREMMWSFIDPIMLQHHTTSSSTAPAHSWSSECHQKHPVHCPASSLPSLAALLQPRYPTSDPVASGASPPQKTHWTSRRRFRMFLRSCKPSGVMAKFSKVTCSSGILLTVSATGFTGLMGKSAGKNGLAVTYHRKPWKCWRGSVRIPLNQIWKSSRPFKPQDDRTPSPRSPGSSEDWTESWS